MPPKSKKGAKNGFYFFMHDLKAREEAKGRRFNGLKEVADYANPIWSRMSAEERECYTKKAKECKGSDDDGRNKFTSLGVSYAEIDAEIREKNEAHQIMLQTIKNTIRSLENTTTLLTHKFYLCHVNYFYKTESGFYSVAEFALSEFNLRDGLLDTLHFFVDPGKIPTGYRYESKDWSEKTHCIPIDSNLGEIDYYKLFIAVQKFLTKDIPQNGRIPPVYTMPDSLNSNMCLSAVKSAFISLCDSCNANPDQFRVYPFPQLFFEIRNKCAETSTGVNHALLMPSVSLVQNEIEKDVFSYAQNIGCAFHEDKDRPIHCSLSIVTRWVYTICDHCCKHLGISLELGKHCPKDADVNWDYKYSRTSCRSNVETSPDPRKNKNSFMPTIIDHGKLQEIREKQFQEQQESLRKAEEIRPPHSVIKPSVKVKVGNSSTERVQDLANGVNNVNFSEEENASALPLNHSLPGVAGPSSLPQNHSQPRRVAGASSLPLNHPQPRVAGRGYQREPEPQEEEPVWPISGRGRFLSKKK